MNITERLISPFHANQNNIDKHSYQCQQLMEDSEDKQVQSLHIVVVFHNFANISWFSYLVHFVVDLCCVFFNSVWFALITLGIKQVL